MKEGAGRDVKKLHKSDMFWFLAETRDHLPAPLHTFLTCVIPMSLMSVFWFEPSHQVYQRRERVSINLQDLTR